jgi:hypothetical protein
MTLFAVSTGEEWFTFGWPHALILGLLTLIYLLLTFANKLPSMASFKDFTDTINSAGGHIIILTLFSAWFFVASMRLIFHIMAMPEELITKQNAIIMAGVGFVTGTAFGGAWGALLKTMSGVKANGVYPPPAAPNDVPAGPTAAPADSNNPPAAGAAPLP